jgi:gliding motility-associated-like protein
MPCNNACLMMHFQYPHPLKTNTYNINNTPFAPVSVGASTILPLGDDTFSNAIPIGFKFCFFENTYTQCYISDNGVLTFSANYANTSCNTNTQQLLPYFNSTFPDLAIFGCYMDLDPTLGGSISYANTGIAPFRKFIVNYNNLRIFGATCNTATSSFQIVLSEGSNEIEIFITNKVVCDANIGNYSNYATIGVQNSGATVAFTAPGKHASNFTSTNEGIKIKPAGALDYEMKLYDKFGFLLATNVDSFWFCHTSNPYQYITTTLQLNCLAEFSMDSLKITKAQPTLDSLVIIKPLCPNSPTGSFTIYASGPNTPFTYASNFSAPQASNTFAGISSGPTVVTITDANGCTKDTVFNLLAISNPDVVLDSARLPVCPLNNGILYVHGQTGVAPYTFLWSNGDVGPIADSLAQGSYTVTITDANGCTKTESFTIVNTGIPAVNFNVQYTTCGNGNGAAYITNITGGTGPYTINWSNGSTNDSLLNVPPAVYFLTIVDVNGCQLDTPVVIVDSFSVSLFSFINPTSCGLNNGSANVLATGGPLPNIYTWVGSASTTATATNLSAGTYTVSVTNAFGCSKSTFINIAPSVANVNNITKANANCDTANGIIIVNSVANSTPPISIAWSNGGSGNSINNLAPGTYTIETTDFKGCKDKDTLVLINDGKPKLNNVSYTQPKCYGDSNGSVTLNGNGGTAPYKYSLDGINYSSFAILNNISGGNNTIYITDANSCINDTIIYFQQPDSLSLFFNTDTVDCATDKTGVLTFLASGGKPNYLYKFNGQDTSSIITTYNNLSAGNYSVQVTDISNCTKIFNLQVVGPDSALTINFITKDVPCFEDNTGLIHASIQGGWPPYVYAWSNGAQGLQLNNINEVNLGFTVSDNRNCKIDTNTSIKQLLCCKMVVPNAFSPNNDNLNDLLKVMAVSDIEFMQLSIFDRFGTKVFTSNAIADKWNGSYNNKPCDLGTYFYVLKYKCPFGKDTFFLKGDVTLIR